ncbi:cofilin/tropomyosin-type actin-binding protein [Ditylenchus destructor]|nr:cofilin/tropomyosin-type actin-binding protein [Ditylenchus destructor]
MACQTGIRADTQLLNFFEACKQCKVRFGKVVINNERLCVNHHYGPTNDWRKDWQKNLPDAVDSYEPCFILFRFDSNHDWILISFADDKASVRDKMLLAATKATFKSDFGQSFIRAEYQVANRNDLTLENFEKRYLNPVAISSNNHKLSTVAKDRAAIPFALQSSQTLRGIQFPIDQDAVQLLKSFARGDIDFVQLSVDTLNEAIKLENSKPTLSVDELSSNISRQKPRYSLFRFSEYDGKPVFFIYSVPPSASCTIKELMLFSSCKAPFLSEMQNECGVKLTKKIEVDSREKLDAETLANYIRPESVATQAPFERPARPGGGPRRITKVSQ